jgi:SpoVK/Ycf46/Vps4 family AAA+-type ATPase
LVLDSKTKDLVKALIMVRTPGTGFKQGLSLVRKRDDLIAGKGNGLIMLLHGGPGTGKTLTAG